jgi:hypothetical protein
MKNLMILILLIISINILSACTNQGKIRVRGMAYKAKGAAIVYQKNNFYFVDGLDDWPEKYKDRRVVVKGILFVRNDTLNVDTTMKIIPQTSGSFSETILSPKYRVSFFGLFRKKPYKE